MRSSVSVSAHRLEGGGTSTAGRCCSEPPSRRYSQKSAPLLSCLCLPTPVSTRRQIAQAPSVLTQHQSGLPQMEQGLERETSCQVCMLTPPPGSIHRAL